MTDWANIVLEKVAPTGNTLENPTKYTDPLQNIDAKHLLLCLILYLGIWISMYWFAWWIEIPLVTAVLYNTIAFEQKVKLKV